MTGGPSLTPNDYNQRLKTLVDSLQGRYGDVVYTAATSPSGQSRKLQITVTIPGSGLPVEATMVFVEKHEWREPEWMPYDYAYDLHLEPKPSGRYAYHWARDVFHVHCDDPAQPGRDNHYKGAAVNDVFWAAQSLFEMIHLGISCRGLQPLRDWQEAL